ncbi:molybdopterin molybdotransferase MoeA [Mesosutterella sp. AGMB02718]|uniref:Molybdopterin molybdenumtransferase n=1 Tax=Mesosutterella faecium TaxID=2925194 RepID=A0ABT7IJJ1_9BURK|nr:gephyrin-like molybdotransferase Glp [Mesosutterella sp. AGMB02718]MDL2058534.1 molybdopterin molybdotransferase MoeA [Mesosutterella sp. AGMB02718]
MNPTFNRRPVSYQEARSSIQSFVRPVRETEELPIEKALSRVLSEDIVSPVNVPEANNSAMDGYAMKFSDLAADGSGTLRLAGESFAGHPFTGRIEPGECIRIMTGAEVPDCCDTVIQQELASVEGSLVSFAAGVGRGGNVRLRGEELRRGCPAIPAGTRLTPAWIGLTATLGLRTVRVYSRPRVAILSTGDELTDPGQPLGKGRIYDANSFSIAALAQRAGAEIAMRKIVRDDPKELLQALEEALEADVILTSGGVSVGAADFTRFVAAQKGEIFNWEVPMRPGRPMAVGVVAGKLLFCLPGNPVAAAVTFLEFARGAIRKTGGELGDVDPPCLTATAEGRFKKRPGRYEMQRGIFRIDEKGRAVVKSTGMQSSAMLTSMCRGNCIVWLDKDRGAVEPGEQVLVQPFFGLLDS